MYVDGKWEKLGDFRSSVDLAPYAKTDYVPSVFWGRSAKFISCLDVGTRIKAVGRLQSREYIKKHDDGTEETKTAYEFSVSTFEVI